MGRRRRGGGLVSRGDLGAFTPRAFMRELRNAGLAGAALLAAAIIVAGLIGLGIVTFITGMRR